MSLNIFVFIINVLDHSETILPFLKTPPFIISLVYIKLRFCLGELASVLISFIFSWAFSLFFVCLFNLFIFEIDCRKRDFAIATKWIKPTAGQWLYTLVFVYLVNSVGLLRCQTFFREISSIRLTLKITDRYRQKSMFASFSLIFFFFGDVYTLPMISWPPRHLDFVFILCFVMHSFIEVRWYNKFTFTVLNHLSDLADFTTTQENQ